MTGSTELLVQTAVQTVRQQNPELPVGLAAVSYTHLTLPTKA